MFALDDAFASTSAKCPESSAFRPNAVNASVTMSDVVARSSPDAAARFMMPSIPFSMSPVCQPAIAMYFIASADSVAENFVFAPISSAFAFSDSRSAPVAPEIAETSLMPASKLDPTSTAYLPSAVAPAPTAVTAAADAVAIAEKPFFAKLPIPCRPLFNLLSSSSARIFTVPSYLPANHLSPLSVREQLAHNGSICSVAATPAGRCSL